MFDLWKDELTTEQETELLDRMAREIKGRGLEAPAILFFEMHKPLAFVGSQAAIVFSPLLVPFVGFDKMNDYSRLLSKRENIDKLLVRLESKGDDALISEVPC